MKALLSGILITRDHWAQMVTDVVAKAPEEACGFVIGEGDRSTLVLPVTNQSFPTC
jgi:proteasome lid subunit RPN8/RPN11